ncbi:hypothetical protein [Hyphomicrobium facile]|uniref:DUF3604 domain-containing protein n=1 Tax=Hyphomicrobium facile TaxID=51670 RepID=A0A1I7MUR1_9HYPH|nr:hypothetical protein [Hyphomicrobium facile]SFV26143.1 hypothetical protein SAMN04488557_0346 [Hyphomicrobium facile]
MADGTYDHESFQEERRIFPQGKGQRSSERPFLGALSCSHERLVAGSWEEVLLTYVVGESGIADGARLKIAFKFYTDWALFQTSDPTAANYVSAEYAAAPLVEGQSPPTVQALKITFDQKGHERPFQKALLIDFVDGYLNPGDTIIIRLGDRRSGGPGTRVQTFEEAAFTFRAYIDPLGTSKFAPVPGDATIEFLAGSPAALSIVTPRLVKAGEKASIRVRAFDVWGNVCRDVKEPVELKITETNKQDVKTIAFPEAGWAVVRHDLMTDGLDGAVEILAHFPSNSRIAAARAVLSVDPGLSVPQAWFADLHVHSDDTVGINSTDYNLRYGRDVAGLDVLGYTANDFNVTESDWIKSVDLIRDLHRDGAFVTFPGTEWCGNSCAGGDHNVIFLHDRQPEFPFHHSGRPARSFEWNAAMQGGTIEPGTWPLNDLWSVYEHDPEGHLLIPHVGGRRANLDWHDPALERLIEVSSTWGHFGWFYQEAISRGYKLGASAAGDEHRGRCGGGAPGAQVFGVRGGLTGVIAPALTRRDIGRALRARHTWATTGERIVGLLSSGAAIQGDEISAAVATTLKYRLLGSAAWDYIAAYDHNGVFWERNLQSEAGYSSRRFRLRWGGARIKDRYRAAKWSGTIKVANAVIHSVKTFGFEHIEEAAWRHGANEVSFKSETYGDADTIEFDVTGLADATITVEGTIGEYQKVGDTLSPALFAHRPTFAWHVSGAQLIDEGVLRRDLGGEGLFLALERLTGKPLPLEVAGELEVDPRNGPHGFRPVYVYGRQIDDEKVWTSPVFITFAQS